MSGLRSRSGPLTAALQVQGTGPAAMAVAMGRDVQVWVPVWVEWKDSF